MGEGGGDSGECFIVTVLLSVISLQEGKSVTVSLVSSYDRYVQGLKD